MVGRTSSGPNRRNRSEHSASPGWSTGRGRRPRLPQSILPKRDVSFLHLRQVGVDSREAGIRFTGRHCTILRRTVDFVLPVFEVSGSLVTVTHQSLSPTSPTFFLISPADSSVLTGVKAAGLWPAWRLAERPRLVALRPGVLALARHLADSQFLVVRTCQRS